MSAPGGQQRDAERTYYDGPLDQKNGKWSSYWGVLKGSWLYLFKDRSLPQAVATYAINSQTQVVVSKTVPPNSYQFFVSTETGAQLRLRCATTQQRTHWMDEIVRCSKQSGSQQHQAQHTLPPATPTRPQPAIPGQHAQQQQQQRPPALPQQKQSPAPHPGPTTPGRGPGAPTDQSRRHLVRQATTTSAPEHSQSTAGIIPSRTVRRPSQDLDGVAQQLPQKSTTSPPPLPGEDASDLRQYSWFFGTMNRDRSEEIIRTASAVGSFVIRQSGSSNNSFSLSFQDEDRIRHYLIAQQTNGKYALAGLEDMSFRSLPDLVKYYIEVNAGWAKPLNKADFGISGSRYQRPPSVRSDSSGSNSGSALGPASPSATAAAGAAPPLVPSSMRRPSTDSPSPSPTSSLGSHPVPPPGPRPAQAAQQQSATMATGPAPAPPPPASRRPVLTRGSSDLDFSRVRAATQQHQQQEEEARQQMRSMSVKVRSVTESQLPTSRAPFPGSSLDDRRQQLFPASSSPLADPSSNPSVPARSAVSLGQRPVPANYQNTAPSSSTVPTMPEQEDYISTAEITQDTAYLNHEFRDTVPDADDGLHDYLDLEDCAPPSSPPPSVATGSSAAYKNRRTSEHLPAENAPNRPRKPGGGGREGSSHHRQNGRHSPLYDQVS
ncbi:uncharacterized protein LOC135826199 isoform X1 [Sycon ciliatum]|uniref:uncharacterized protein LOC135826199 isoform X1 n=1 Tax=Sycon ciliatum TaxID=27933 RepID=UPI0031F71D8B